MSATNNETEKVSIYHRIAMTTLSVGGLRTDKRNPQGGYDYISADKILNKTGQAMAGNGLVVIPAILAEKVHVIDRPNNKFRFDAVIELEMTIADSDDNTISRPWFGRGTDYTSPDKALYKAITSGHKYFLMKLFNIGVGNEDDEHDEQTRQQNGRQPAQREAPPSSDPAPGPTWEDLDQHSQDKALHPVIADLRANLEAQAKDGTIKIGLVCDHAVMAKVGYEQANHPLNALKNEEAGYPLPDGVELEWKMATVVKTSNGLKFFDWLIERKAEAA